MKETYERPDIMFEDFSLSSNIATNCESIVGQPAKDQCGVLTSSGDVIFVSEETGCEFTAPEDDEWDGFCYHVPTEYNNLFNS